VLNYNIRWRGYTSTPANYPRFAGIDRITRSLVRTGAMKKIVFSLTVLGFLSAALFYWPFGGVSETFRHFCPLCPNVDSIGSPLSKFARRTATVGTLNAIVYSVIGVLMSLTYRFLRQRR
jgi:hypothetical protein